MKNIYLFFTFIIVSSLAACTNNKEAEIIGNISACDTLNTKYASVIAPILNTNCNAPNGCHGGSSAASIKLETYDQVKNNYTNILTRIKSGNMPKNMSKLDDCSISKIQKWVDNGALNN